MEFVMTFKKINKMGQSIIEYFLLYAAVLAAILFFADTQIFKDIKENCRVATNETIHAISGVEEGNTITP